MSNLDKLVAEILQQAQKEANRMLTKAKTENSEFSEKENKKIQKEVDAINDKAQEEAQALKERVISNANLKSRDMILQAKEELADDILEKVLERLKNIDSKKYLKFVENILKTIKKGQEMIIELLNDSIIRFNHSMEILKEIVMP